jgi:transposase
MASLAIERGLAGPGLLAHVMVLKCGGRIPFRRQSVIYARSGVDLDRSTMAARVGRMDFLLRLLVDRMDRHIRAGSVFHADDTPVPVLKPGAGRTKTGHLWVLLRDERSWGSGVPPAVIYRYSPDRKKERAIALLKDCRGFLHADAYNGFQDLYKSNDIGQTAGLMEVACWAHYQESRVIWTHLCIRTVSVRS